MMRWMLTLIFVGGTLIGGGWAQTIDRTKPPETPPLAAYKLPLVKESKLSNGLSVVLAEDKRFPLVTLRLVFPAGTRYEPAEKLGLAETAASLLRAGTTKRTSRQIAEELAEMGGAMNASSSAESLTVEGNVLAENLEKLLDVVSDSVRNSQFPKDEVELRKQNREQELALERSQSQTLGDEAVRKTVFGKHPYSRGLPTVASIQGITRADLVSFREKMLNPGQGTLILVGALPETEKLQAMLQSKFGAWTGKGAAVSAGGEIPKATRSIVLVDRPGSAQVDILTGHVTVNRSDKDYFPLLVGNSILGGGASSRLFMNIREKQGFAYQSNSVHVPMKDTGLLMGVTQVREEVLEPALRALLDEFGRMGKEPVSTDELRNTKNFINGSFVLGLSNQDGVAANLAAMKSNGMPNSYLESFVTRVRSVEPDQIQRVAAKYMDPDSTTIVIVGDAKKIAPTVEKFGKVKIERPQ